WRAVRVTRGEALFDVAHDTARPFVVEARGMSARAVGTRFAVRGDANGPGEVFVQEGRVDFGRAGALEPTPLFAGCHAVARPSGEVDVTHIGVEAVGQALAWQTSA